MATLGEERELLKKGLEQDGVVRGVWAQNLWLAQGAISVRPGWGVRAELDTTLTNNLSYDAAGNVHFEESSPARYEKHLGSALVQTNFGHKQVVSVFMGKLNGGNLGADVRNENYDRYYAVRIFDIDTRQSWEEILYRTTAEMVGGNNPVTSYTATSHPSEWHGNYETSFNVDNSGFKTSDFESKWFFHVAKGLLYFGSPSVGVFVYQPADFSKQVYQQLDTASQFDWLKGYSESGLILKVHFTNGVYEEGFNYADENNISKVVAATSFRGRMAYATEYEIWFSDVGRPNNVIATNFIFVPSSSQVTAMREFKGNLIIFTKNEMFIWTPTEGVKITEGARPPVKISESVGCIGQQAVTMMEDDLAWVSHSGVFVSSDGVSLKETSEPIRGFWGGHGLMTNPMTSYYEAAAGWVDIDDVTPPRTLLSFEDDRVTLAYNHEKRALVMGCPNVNGCWAFTGIWSWWPMESSVTADAVGAPVVSATKNLLSPWVMATPESIYSVCGVETSEVTDASQTIISSAVRLYPAFPGNQPSPSPGALGSYVVCELGYGGALDRSSDKEDYRNGAGQYLPVILPDAEFDYGAFYFSEPREELDTTTGATRYWVSVDLVPPNNTHMGGNPIEYYELLFSFDQTQWNPEPTALPNSDIDLRFPTERYISHTTAGTVTAKVTDAAAAPNPTGGYIHVRFNGPAVGTGWTYHPDLNITEKRRNPLFEISFLKVTALSVKGFYVWPTRSIVQSSSHTVAPVAMLVWSKQFIGAAESHNDNAKAQAVDWCYKSDEISTGTTQLRARGIYAKMNSHGRGLPANRIVPNWVWGLYNVILGSDSKEYTSQIVDYDNDIQKIEDKVTIRSRFRDVNGAMQKRVFGSSATDSPLWGRASTPADGNYLIDDQETDAIATSDSIKGQRISYMVFGFIQDRAESLSLQSLLGVFRRGGRRRRTGR